jgi:anti-sigma regulatory factor (Ser/Thr protein kinase)
MTPPDPAELPGPRPMTRPSRQRPVRVQLPASLLAPRQARAAIRHVLSSWGLSALAGDAALIASELVANSAEHAPGTPVGLTIRPHAEPSGRPGILCQITDTSPVMPKRHPLQPDSERGRGLHIVTALATATGITTSPDGKTAWFTLTDRQPERNLQPDLEPEAGA